MPRTPPPPTSSQLLKSRRTLDEPNAFIASFTGRKSRLSWLLLPIANDGMGLARSFFIFVLFVGTTYVALLSLQSHIDPNKAKTAEEREDARWIATSKWWLDRQSCRYIGLCGLAHWHPDPAAKPWKLRRDDGNEDDDLEGELNAENFNDYGWKDFTAGRKMRPGDLNGDERVLRETPQYVLDHAPLIHLYSKEQFWPADIAEHIKHLGPHVNYTKLKRGSPTLANIHELNEGYRGIDVFIQTYDDVEDRPAWLHSAYNKPEPYGDEEVDPDEGDIDEDDVLKFGVEDMATEKDYETWFDPFGPGEKRNVESTVPPPRKHNRPARPHKTELRQRRRKRMEKPPGGYSNAPATLIMVDKGHGIVDAFWFYFYSYNLGTTVLNIRFGNHVGDWEHSLIRFHHGVPKAVFFSAHSGGTSFAYDAVEKGVGPGREGRPVFYSAVGSHAMYAMPGSHPYVLPWGLLADLTDKGPLWDPALNHRAYFLNMSITHDVDTQVAVPGWIPPVDELPSLDMQTLPPELDEQRFEPALNNPDAPTGWFWYSGHWGDKFYTLGDWRQWRFARQYHYVNGPMGPRYKNLGRSTVCGNSGTCKMLATIEEGKKASWLGMRRIGEGDRRKRR